MRLYRHVGDWQRTKPVCPTLVCLLYHRCYHHRCINNWLRFQSSTLRTLFSFRFSSSSFIRTSITCVEHEDTMYRMRRKISLTVTCATYSAQLNVFRLRSYRSSDWKWCSKQTKTWSIRAVQKAFFFSIVWCDTKATKANKATWL